MHPKEEFSMETILTTNKPDFASNWSQIWSTSHVAGMDRAIGEGAARGEHGRRKLRVGALALASCLTVQCRVAAFSLTGGYLIFVIFLIVAVTMIANPMRHFEVYLGQWSVSGPGRAFRIIPVVDGIGIAICINVLIRAIYCSTVAAIAGIYLTHAIRDSVLPFKYCRDFQLNSYQPINHTFENSSINRFLFESPRGISESLNIKVDWIGTTIRKGKMCKESYKGVFPPLQMSPAYNFFYVEVMRLRKLTMDFGTLNGPLAISVTVVWIIMWIFMLVEKIIHKRVIFNNIHNWFILVPWLFVLLFLMVTLVEVIKRGTYPNAIRIGTKEFYYGFTNGLEVAVYIHSASFGTEIIHGKGLHYYASGHIDPLLYDENIWHSVILVVLAMINATSITACALLCSVNPEYQGTHTLQESILWVMPMYSKCLSLTPFSHATSTVVFGGLMFSYMIVAYTMIKTALHTIFEYKVKLVFIEQPIIIVLVICGLSLNLLFATGSGVLLLECMDAITTGVGVPFICLMELVGILYMYRSTDFESDMDVATEENKCGYRIGMQWKILPAITGVFLVIKVISVFDTRMPSSFMLLGSLPLVAIILAVPLRAACNSFKFLNKLKRKP